MTVRYCGRYFTPAELDLIQGLIKAQPTREAIARAMCAELNWIKPDGLPKVIPAKVVLLRMHRDGLIVLPAPRNKYNNARRPPVLTLATAPQMAIPGTRRNVPDLCLRGGSGVQPTPASGINSSNATITSATCHCPEHRCATL